jgi:hypothetical protein
VLQLSAISPTAGNKTVSGLEETRMSSESETAFARLSKWVGLIGGLLGIMGGILGALSFLSYSDELRIATALDVSRSYLRETQRETIKLFNEADSNSDFSLDQRTRIAEFGDTAEYISLLANEGRLDIGYLSQAVVCAIETTANTIKKYRLVVPNGGKEMNRFSKSHPCQR